MDSPPTPSRDPHCLPKLPECFHVVIKDRGIAGQSLEKSRNRRSNLPAENRRAGHRLRESHKTAGDGFLLRETEEVEEVESSYHIHPSIQRRQPSSRFEQVLDDESGTELVAVAEKFVTEAEEGRDDVQAVEGG